MRYDDRLLKETWPLASPIANPPQGVLQMASLNGVVALGERAGKRVRRVVTLGGKEFALGPRCASFDGYNVHANVSLAAHGEGPVVRFAPRAPTP